MNSNLMEQFSTFADQVGQPQVNPSTAAQPTPAMQGSVVKRYEGSGLPETVREDDIKPKKNKTLIIVGVCVAVLVVIGIVVYFVINRKKKNDDNTQPSQVPSPAHPPDTTYEDQVNDARAQMAAKIQANLRNQIASARSKERKTVPAPHVQMPAPHVQMPAPHVQMPAPQVQVPFQTPSSIQGNAATLQHTGPVAPIPRPQTLPQQLQTPPDQNPPRANVAGMNRPMSARQPPEGIQQQIPQNHPNVPIGAPSSMGGMPMRNGEEDELGTAL